MSPIESHATPYATDFTFPNGLAFSADFSKLYLAVSSPEEPAWYVYDLGENGDLTNRRRFLDALPMREVRFAVGPGYY